MMKKLVTALLLSVSSLVSAQNIDPNTGSVQVTPNVIDSTKWGNVIYMNATQLGQVEGSGGGPVPAFNTDTNTIRFSYMPYTASQLIAINSVLSGQGISVSGFNYSWKIYNDLQNCCSTRGSLFVNGSLTDKSGKVLESYFYDYSLTNTGANFQTFAGTETFSSPYQLSSLGDISISWTGSDINFWSGYYGPRVRDTSLTLNYSVKQTSTSPTPTTTTNTGTSSPIEIADTFSKPPPESEPKQQEQQIAYSSPPPPGSEPPPPGSTTTASTSQPPPSGSSQTTPTGSPPPPGSQPPPSSSNNVASAGPTQQQQQQAGPSSSGPSLSSVLTTIKNNEKKEQAIAQAAVSGANEVAQTAVSATEQTALSVAAMSVTSSQTSSTYNNSSSSSNNDASTSSKSSLAMGVPLVTPNTQTGPLQGSSNLVTNSTSMQGSIIVNQSAQQVAMINVQPLQSTQQVQQVQSSQIQLRGPESSELKNNDNDNVMFSNNFLTNRSNPITSIVENNTRTNNSERNEQPNTTVKTNVQPNELAGNVDITSIAVVPVGYSVYTGLILKDVAFYAPKEIYRNQRVIDNQRAVRLLNFASELKHQEMVNQQYGEK